MSSTTAQMREWHGPAILTLGLRPFFLLGAFWAALSMLLWILMLMGGLNLPTAFAPADWHAHTFLFGYFPAIMTGFLLTAVPNWTGRLPVVGWPLGALVLCWVAGRIAVMMSLFLTPWIAALVDLSAIMALAALLAREIFLAKNWRNLVVVALLVALLIGGIVFHLDAASGVSAAQGLGTRIALGSAIMMISVVGGRIVPSFTRNWLVKMGDPARPAPPMQRFDKICLLVTLIALVVWVIFPMSYGASGLLIVMGLLQLVRVSRWRGGRTAREPLVWVLHLAYAFIPIGALALGGAVLAPDLVGLAAAQHLWMAGAVGLMTLAVMTRATHGHTGQPLHAGFATTLIYLSIIAAVILRLLAGAVTSHATTLYAGAGILWCGAFVLFMVIYGPLLLRRRLPAEG